MLPPLRGVLILVTLLRHFAEFLNSSYVLAFVFSTCSLVADWYSLYSPPLGEELLDRRFLIAPGVLLF